MSPQSEIDDFRKYWRRRKPGASTAVYYSSDVRIFFKWAEGCAPDAVTVMTWIGSSFGSKALAMPRDHYPSADCLLSRK